MAREPQLQTLPTGQAGWWMRQKNRDRPRRLRSWAKVKRRSSRWEFMETVIYGVGFLAAALTSLSYLP